MMRLLGELEITIAKNKVVKRDYGMGKCSQSNLYCYHPFKRKRTNELKSKARHEKMTKKVMLSCDLRDLAVDCVTFGQMGKCFFRNVLGWHNDDVS